MPAIPLSAVIIAANEGSAIRATLQSLAFIDDVVVLLSEPNTLTEKVAQSMGAKTFVQAWRGFGPQKNASIALAKHDWILSIDADEVVSDALAKNIIEIFRSPTNDINVNAHPSPVAYRLRRINHFMGRALYYGEGGSDWLIRLFHRAHVRWSEDMVHEVLQCALPSSSVVKLHGLLQHHSADDLTHYLHKQIRYSKLSAESPRYANLGFSPWRLIANPTVRFIRFYLLKQGFRDGSAGLAHILVGCFATFCKYLFIGARANSHKDDARV